MAGPNVRIDGMLKDEAAAYAASLGISLTALVAVALRDYLDARRPDRQQAPALARASMPQNVSLPPEPVSTMPPASAPLPSPPAHRPAPPVARVGRNDPCPCGSGRKAKHCHPENC